MFPIRDDNPTLDRSVVTVAIVALNALAWVFVQGLGSEQALATMRRSLTRLAEKGGADPDRGRPRRKLRGAGWTDLAAAIRGHSGRYILSL